MLWLNIIIATISVFSLGCFFHFSYVASHRNKFVAYFSAVNESIWEHIKIGLTANFIYGIMTAIIFGYKENYLISLALSCFLIVTLIPAFFYFVRAMYNKKKVPIFVDVLEFFVSIFLSQWAFFSILFMDDAGIAFRCIGVVMLILIFTCYSIFTFFPPKLGLFVDFRNGKYGLEAGERVMKRGRKVKKHISINSRKLHKL